jgi:hypothetical protein
MSDTENPLAGRVDAKGIPLCDRPAECRVTYDPTRTEQRTMEYCIPHFLAFCRSLDARGEPYMLTTIPPWIKTTPCMAWKDV